MNDYSNKMYSIININYLNNFVYKNINDKEKKYIKTLFEIERIYNKCNKKNAISICLFCQDQLNKDPNSCVYYFKDKNSYWYKR